MRNEQFNKHLFDTPKKSQHLVFCMQTIKEVFCNILEFVPLSMNIGLMLSFCCTFF